MSLAMDLLRIVTVRALRGKTWALDNVIDSPATPADIRVESDRTPFIAVFVDEADTAQWKDMRDVNNITLVHPTGVRLVIEVGVAGPHTFDPDDPDSDDTPPAPQNVTEINSTDAGLEFQIGMISHQVREALLSTSEQSPWSEIWRMIVAGALTRIEIVRGGPPAEAQRPRPRYASRITVIHTGVIGVPPRGSSLAEYPIWQTALAAMEGDDELGEVGTIMRAHIERTTGPLPEWRMAQKLLTVPKQTAKALGIAPVEGGDSPSDYQTEEPVAPLHEVNLADEQPDPPLPGDDVEYYPAPPFGPAPQKPVGLADEE